LNETTLLLQNSTGKVLILDYEKLNSVWTLDGTCETWNSFSLVVLVNGCFAIKRGNSVDFYGSNRELQTLRSATDTMRFYAISRNCSQLAMVSEDCVEIWSMQNERWIQDETIGLRCQCCAFSPNGRFLVTSSKKIQTLWEVSKGSFREKTHWENNSTNISWYCEFSPNGKLLATCQGRTAVSLRNVNEEATNQILQHQHVTDDYLHSCAFSPDGLLLATMHVLKAAI